MMAGDDIVDAVWEEVPDHGGKLHVARAKPEGKGSPSSGRRNEPTYPSPWLDAAFWRDSVGLFFRGLWRVGLVVLIVFLLFVVIIALAGGFKDDLSATEVNDHVSASNGTAKQALSDWSQAVMGRASTIGFTLIDGAGKPGEFCNSSSGTSMMNFGGRTLPPAHADLYNYFGWLHAKRDVGIVGFFSFDVGAGELVGHDLIEGNTVTDRHHDIKDKRMKVAREAPGIVDIDGTRYHVCVL